MGACCASQHQPGEPSPFLMNSHQAHASQERPAYAQTPAVPFQQQAFQQQPQAKDQSPFMSKLAPDGRTWREYVESSSPFVDMSTSMLVGPWAECICWGVHFEHTSSAWQSMPEYADAGPVGGILAALEASVAGRANWQELLDAGEELEGAAHEAAKEGRPLPIIGCCAGQGQPQAVPQHTFGVPAYAAPYESHPGYQHPAGPPPCGVPGYAPPCGPPGYEQYGQSYMGGPQQPYSAGPTLLQQQHHQGGDGGGMGGGGMGGGGKMAMAAAGGVAAGVGGYYLATHMDDVAGAVGGAAGFVGHAFEGAGDLVVDAVEDVGDFVEDMF